MFSLVRQRFPEKARKINSVKALGICFRKCISFVVLGKEKNQYDLFFWESYMHDKHFLYETSSHLSFSMIGGTAYFC